jgi:hypothetical protein
MKLAMVAESIIVEDSGASLHKCIVDLGRDKKALQLAVDHDPEDYEMVVASFRNLSSEHDQLKICCESLLAELAQARFDAEKRVSDLEAKVKFAEACGIEIAAEGEKNLGILEVCLFNSWRDCARCMLIRFRVSEACAQRCRWRSLWWRII